MVSDSKPYGFSAAFERELAVALLTRPAVYGHLGPDLDPSRFASGEDVRLAIKVARLYATEHGRGPSSPSIAYERARLLVHGGKLTQEELDELGELLSSHDRLPSDDDLVATAAVVLRRDLEQTAILKAMELHGARKDVAPALEGLKHARELGRVDKSTGLKLGLGALDSIRRLRQADRLPTPCLELDFKIGGGLPRGKAAIIAMTAKGGKCHSRGQGILTYSGEIVKVEDIRVGDRLMGPDSKPRTVLQTNTGRGEMFDIVPKRGEPWRVNGDHILTVSLHGKVIDVPVHEWCNWDPTRREDSRLIRTGVDFPVPAEVPLLDPYLLGVLLGDGGFTATGVTVTSADPEIVTEMESCARAEGLVLKPYPSKTRGAATLYGFCGRAGRKNAIMASLETYGLRGLGCEDKFVPPVYLVSPRWVRLDVLAGLLDTDGSLIVRHSAAYDYVSASKQLAADVAFLARSLGLSAVVSACRKGCQTGAVGDYWRVRIAGDVDIVPCRVPRKRAHRSVKKYAHRNTGFRVEPAGVEDYYGFTLDGDGRYLLDDFTVTHNSFWLTGQSGVGLGRGLFVACATLELSEEDQSTRLISLLSTVPIDDITGGSRDAEVEERLEALLPTLGIYRVKFFPARITHFGHIARWIEDIEQEEGQAVDLLVMDYLDKLGSTNPKCVSAYEIQGQAAEDFRLYVYGRGLWGWSASQPKRKDASVKGSRRLGIDDLADSQEKVRVMDLIVTGHRPAEGQVELYVPGSRISADGFSVGPFTMDLARAQFIAAYQGGGGGELLP